MKFGQLIEYNMKNMKNHIQNVVETTPWPLSFVCQIEDYRNMSKLSCRPLAFTSFKVKKKKKKRSGTSFPGSFSAWFFKKNISLVIFYHLLKFHCLVAFTSWDIGQSVFCLLTRLWCLLTRLWRQKFWN